MEVLRFEHEGETIAMTVRRADGFELRCPAPALVGLELRVDFGPATAFALHRPAIDPYWRVRGNDLERAAVLFNEAPWPIGLIALSGRREWPAPPLYRLTVENSGATVAHRQADLPTEVVERLGRRLLQLTTRPARWEAEIAALSMRNRKRNGPYR
jgi:hypothetical protein